MLPLGDNLMVSSDGMSWLFWVHLLVMFLLIILLFNFTIFGFDFSDEETDCEFICKGQNQMQNLRSKNNSSCSTSQDGQVNEGRRTSTMSTRRRSERDTKELEGPSIQEVTETTSVACYLNTPCYYLDLAKRAFLKCLGLDSTSEDSSATQRTRTQ